MAYNFDAAYSDQTTGEIVCYYCLPMVYCGDGCCSEQNMENHIRLEHDPKVPCSSCGDPFDYGE